MGHSYCFGVILGLLTVLRAKRIRVIRRPKAEDIPDSFFIEGG
jgi:hypothetical protein